MPLYSLLDDLMEEEDGQGQYIDFLKTCYTEPRLTSSIIQLINFYLDDAVAPGRGSLDLVAFSYLCNMIIADAAEMHKDVNFENSVTTMALHFNQKQLSFIKDHVSGNFESGYLYRLMEDDFTMFLCEFLEENESPSDAEETKQGAN